MSEQPDLFAPAPESLPEPAPSYPTGYCPCGCGVTGRSPEEWLRHAESLRLVAEGARLQAEGYRRAADAMRDERLARARRARRGAPRNA